MFWEHVANTFLFVMHYALTTVCFIGAIQQAEAVRESEGWWAFGEGLLFLGAVVLGGFLLWAGGYLFFIN